MPFLSPAAVLAQMPWEPTPKTEAWWLERHQEILNTTASLGENIKVVFIGSSTIEYFGTTGKEVWDSKYAPLGAVNYGIRGDGTEHLLWRIENGELDGLSPKLVVIYIGGNNIRKFSEDDSIRGINAAIDKIHEKLPNSNLLYVAFFPRGDLIPIKDALTVTRNVTDRLKPMIEGDVKRNAHFLDLFWSYAPESMDRINEEYYREDKLHQNLLGYQMWENLMSSVFNSLIETK